MTTTSLAYDLTLADWTRYCTDHAQPAYRARQIWKWLYNKQAVSWEPMSDLPPSLRQQLGKSFSIGPPKAILTEEAQDGTQKAVLELLDRQRIECVLIPADSRRTLCLSTQVGCRFHCAFCASGQSGFTRNLSAGEILQQVLFAADRWGQNPSHVVFMGIGEPFDNYEATLQAVRTINEPMAFGIGARRMTISTCGVVPGIERLAEESLQVELSVSLHAPDDDLRSQLMPVNRHYPMDQLLPACADYTKKTGRIITFEYAVIREVNDSIEDASRLAARLQSFPCRVNLIPLSPVDEFTGKRPSAAVVESFRSTLESAGINTTIRHSRGSDLAAACGQLRAHVLSAE